MPAVTSSLESLPRLARLESLLNAAAIFILATIFLLWDGSRAVYVLTALAALYYLVRYRPPIPVENRLYSWPIIGFFCAGLLSVLVNGMTDSGFNELFSQYMLLLLAVPLACLFYLSFDARRNFWVKFAVACVVMGATALYEVAVLDIQRADGGHNPSRFGFVALAMTAVVLASYRDMASLKFGNAVFGLALLLGVLAMGLSGTRTSWLAGLAVFVIALLYHLDRYSLFRRVAATLVVVTAIVAAFSVLPNVEKRFEQMIDIVAPYFVGNGEIEDNSFSRRVELWKAAWSLGKENPVFGFGLGETRGEISDYAGSRPEVAEIANNAHFHNQFMQSFAMTGVIGLISLLVMLGCHGWLFGRYLSKRYDPRVRALALAGLLLLIAYLVKSLSGVPFHGKQYLVMYGISSAAIWGSLLGALHRPGRATDQPAA